MSLRAWPVEVAGWKHVNDKGRESWSFKVSKSFKNRDGNYENTDFLSSRDLPAASALLLEAHRRTEIETRQVAAPSDNGTDEEPKAEAPY
jgi:hypothetical protein